MKEVLKFIESKKQEFIQLPFFEFLQDHSINPMERLAFAPCMAPFAMGFGELNRDVFREEPTSDPIQAVINRHTYEDDQHWLWFLEDLRNLNLDQSLQFGDALRFLWSEETRISRQAIYELYRYSFQANLVQKMVIIEVSEATGGAFLSASKQVAHELQKITNKKYQYFGDHHFSVDSKHSINLSETEQFLETIQLTEDIRKETIDLAQNVFEVFTKLANSFFDYATRHRLEKSWKYTTMLEQFSALKPPQAQTEPMLIPQGTENVQSPYREKHLGSCLIEAGLLTHKQLEAALDEQKDTDMRISEVISSKGWISQQTIEYMIEKAILPKQPRKVKPLGSYLVEADLITPDQIESALNEQKITAMPIGKVISKRGWVDQQTIEFMMEKVILPERKPSLSTLN